MEDVVRADGDSAKPAAAPERRYTRGAEVSPGSESTATHGGIPRNLGGPVISVRGTGGHPVKQPRLGGWWPDTVESERGPTSGTAKRRKRNAAGWMAGRRSLS